MKRFPSRYSGPSKGVSSGEGERAVNPIVRERGGRGRRSRRALVWIAVSVALFALAYPGLRGLPGELAHVDMAAIRAHILSWGLWGPIASIVVMTAHTFLPIPGEFVVAINGAVFGFWGGLAVSWAGAVASASLAFGIGRLLGHARTPRTVPQKMLRWVDTVITQGDWTVALVIRFIPLFPFGVFNFALGRTALSWPAFLWTTALGVLPVNAAVVAIGYGAAQERRVLLWGLGVLLGLTMLGLIFRYRIAGWMRGGDSAGAAGSSRRHGMRMKVGGRPDDHGARIARGE